MYMVQKVFLKYTGNGVSGKSGLYSFTDGGCIFKQLCSQRLRKHDSIGRGKGCFAIALCKMESKYFKKLRVDPIAGILYVRCSWSRALYLHYNRTVGRINAGYLFNFGDFGFKVFGVRKSNSRRFAVAFKSGCYAV